MKLIDLTGEKFGHLTVLEKARTRNGQPSWTCSCVCGNVVDILGHRLRTGETKSCGCKKLELFRDKYFDLPARTQREYDKSILPCMRHAGICFHGSKCYFHKFDRNCIAAKNAEVEA